MLNEISGGVCAARGFQAAGVHCGVKASSSPDKNDLALILSERECAAAAVYTLNRVKSAPVYVTMDHLEDGTAWGVVANSGNANACCPMSHEYAEEMARLAARATGRAPADFVVASTGVIGQTLNIAAIRAGMPAAECLVSEGSDVEIKRCGSAGLFVRCVAGRRLRSASFGVGSVGETSARAIPTRYG